MILTKSKASKQETGLALFVIALLIGIVGWAVPIADVPISQTGTESVTIAGGGNSGTTFVSFSPAFATTPRVFLTITGTSSVGSQTGITVPMAVPDTAPLIWTNQPAANTEFLGLTLHRHFITNTAAYAGIVVIYVNVITAGAAGSTLQVDCSIDSGGSWTAWTGTVAIDVTGLQTSALAFPPSSCQTTSVWFRISGTGGNGITDPEFGSIGFSNRVNFSGVSLQAQSVTTTDFTINAFVVQNLAFGFTWSVQWLAYVP